MRPHGVSNAYPTREEDPTCCIRRLVSRLDVSYRRKDGLKPAKPIFHRLSQTSQERRDASLTERPVDATVLTPSDVAAAEEKGKTVLYLAYGSNLCNETFRKARGIRPLSQINVLVPTLRLTFDLPGIPYTEPCFANSAIRDPGSDVAKAVEGKPDYHKDRWHKGMVGCVYEVTPSDYAHIIATEGGGASYEDVLVDCYPLPSADTVPSTPTTSPFKAHTLFAPIASATSPFRRPDPSYAQPSARYLKLITDGATELELPTEYQEYLNGIRSYTITSKRQQVGKVLFASIWMPFVLMLFGLGKTFQDDEGRVPQWLGMLLGWVFKGMWVSYDGVFRRAFGNGERTEECDEEDEGRGSLAGVRKSVIYCDSVVNLV
ncbi:hypothetical protein P280DRAFT_388527 [Massarina eburnea CBS 473.64]|uniref:gamma-glutamylcyclotransferase n=1 Tax=Massarina eburnea CBS 473.64 TaxID=1395130 RepID=A0A6A6SD05_9PLEO|nr:hypothetical protein P280DRAFT_388527 [Massarina eburnea CBS 473.64]